MSELQIIDPEIKQWNLSLCLLSKITVRRKKQLRKQMKKRKKACNGRCKTLAFFMIHSHHLSIGAGTTLSSV